MQDSIALCEQVTALDTGHIIEYIGTVDEETLSRMTEAVQVQVGVFHKYNLREKHKVLFLESQAIADKLNQDGILSPMEYKRSIGIRLETTFKKGIQAKWSYNAVLRILKNEVYIGVLTQGKQTTPNYKVKTRVRKPEEEWITVENAQEPIISKKDFALVQELLKQDTRISPDKEVLFPLAGMLSCGDCMEPMVRKTVPAGGKKYVYYVCSGNKKDKTSCSPHRIPEADLVNSVLYLLQTHIENVLTLEAVMQVIEKAPRQKADVAKFEERIKKKQTELETAIHSYERERTLVLENKSSIHEWIKDFKQYRNIQSLDRNAAAVMIKRVVVYSADRIEVTYNFEDEFIRCQEYVEAYGKPDREEMVSWQGKAESQLLI